MLGAGQRVARTPSNTLTSGQPSSSSERRSERGFITKIVNKANGSATMLLGEDAKLPALEQQVVGKRYVHLATHGLTGSADRPYDASLALTQPQTPSPDDIGFLTLDDLIRKWRGKLSDCDLVVLSACDTQRGVKVGDSIMALPWGFFYAGAPSVIASLWKVDDTATTLLMTRLYEDLLGQFEVARPVGRTVYRSKQLMPKADALPAESAYQSWKDGSTGPR